MYAIGQPFPRGRAEPCATARPALSTGSNEFLHPQELLALCFVITLDMSAAPKRLDGDLRGPATAWLRAKGVEGPSPATQAARRADLAGVAACLADVLERPDAGLPPDAPAFDEHLAQLHFDDLTEENLVAAIAAFAADGRAPASVRRALSTWRGFCKWLVREGHLFVNPLEDVRGPKRPDWAPKPLELAELERVMTAAATADPRAAIRGRSGTWPSSPPWPVPGCAPVR